MIATLLSILGPNGILWALGAAVVAAFGLYWKGRKDGGKSATDKLKAKEADAYEQHLREIADAGNARPSRSVPDDPYNRDRK